MKLKDFLEIVGFKYSLQTTFEGTFCTDLRRDSDRLTGKLDESNLLEIVPSRTSVTAESYLVLDRYRSVIWYYQDIG